MTEPRDGTLDSRLLDRYLANVATPAEREVVLAWLAQHPRERLLADQLSGPRLSGYATPDFDVDAHWAKIRANMAAPDQPEHARGNAELSHSRTRTRPRPEVSAWQARNWSFMAAAGALLVAIVVAAGVFARSSAPTVTEVSEVVVRTARGQRADFRLPDGTHVVLGVQSTLRYPKHFGSESRSVILQGEAYFDVMRAAGMPFVVHASRSSVRVLGTSFAVRKYADDQSVKVTVALGRVLCDTTVLNAGDIAHVGANGMTVVHDAKTASQLAWASGKLVFDDTPLRDVFRELERWYDVEFVLGSAGFADRTVTATFTNLSIDDVAQGLANSVGARQVREGRVITFVAPEAVPK